MNIDQKFAVWCAKKCLHLWKPSRSVIDWLHDPTNSEKKDRIVEIITWVRINTKSDMNFSMRWARRANYSAYYAICERGATWVERASRAAATALNTTTNELKHEFVSTLTNEELKIIDPEWIDYLTAEIFARN